MISSSSSLASSIPATSAKVTLLWLSLSSLAFDFPKDIALPPPACSWRMRNRKISRMMATGTNCTASDIHREFRKRAPP